MDNIARGCQGRRGPLDAANNLYTWKQGGASTKQGIRVEAGGLLEDQEVIKRVNGVSWEDPVSQD